MLDQQPNIFTCCRVMYIQDERMLRAEADIPGSTSEFQSASRHLFLSIAHNMISQAIRR